MDHLTVNSRREEEEGEEEEEEEEEEEVRNDVIHTPQHMGAGLTFR